MSIANSEKSTTRNTLSMSKAKRFLRLWAIALGVVLAAYGMILIVVFTVAWNEWVGALLGAVVITGIVAYILGDME